VRVVVAPDKFAGTLTAVQAAEAMADGWRRTAPGTDLVLAPLADGGPGFLDVLQSSLAGELLAESVRGPLGVETPAALLRVGDTAYVESAQACGLDLLAPEGRDPAAATTYGVGQLVAAAVDSGARRVVVGLGGSATNDGGAGLLAALGATSAGAPLDAGGLAIAGVESVDLSQARRRLAGVELVAASDVDNPLAGPGGASMVYGGQKGADRALAAALDTALQHWGRVTDEKLARSPGAGAAGGLGHALLLLGATRVNGIECVMDAVGLRRSLSRADLVLTGEGSFDWQSLRGKVVAGVARTAAHTGTPVLVLAGRVRVGRREMATLGVESAYAVADSAAEARASMERPAERLADLACRVARTWSRGA
jgi:glycerate kinase